MKLIVGLGNPGKEYEKTRHNVGFKTIDQFASSKGLLFNKTKFGGIYTEYFVEQEKILLLKPQNYINLSGEVIKRYLDYFNINIDDMLIISDDLDHKVGEYKLRYQGSSGGHNGLKDIEHHLKTKQYKRIKIGISNNKTIETKDYVLGKFTKEEQLLIDSVIEKIEVILGDYPKLSFDNLMNKYN